MTLREWLLAREPKPPAALSARLLEVLGADAECDTAGASHVLVAASERLVSQLLRNGATGRTSALDLLVADSLVTYAFEGGFGEADTISERARTAMRRIASLAPVST